MLFKMWNKLGKKTVEEVAETLILEQFLSSEAPDVQEWLKEHNTTTGQRAAELVEAFLAACKGPTDCHLQGSSRPKTRGKYAGYGSGVGSGVQSRVRGTHPDTTPLSNMHHPGPQKPHLCYCCGRPGHLIRDCPVGKEEGLTLCSVVDNDNNIHCLKKL